MTTTNNDEAFNQILLEALQSKVWNEVIDHFESLDSDQQHEILSEFARVLHEHGAGSKEMWEFFNTTTMKMSRTYYLVESIGNDKDSKWDDAVEKELQ